jgi:hypothetical protein
MHMHSDKTPHQRVLQLTEIVRLLQPVSPTRSLIRCETACALEAGCGCEQSVGLCQVLTSLCLERRASDVEFAVRAPLSIQPLVGLCGRS